MALTNAGVGVIAEAAIGQGNVFNSANAHIGVGNGTAAFSAAQNDLQGANKKRMPMDVGYPVAEAPMVKFKSTFGHADANFAWNEWGVFNSETGGVMLNRVIESNGTKQSNQTWVMEVEITFTVGN